MLALPLNMAPSTKRDSYHHGDLPRALIRTALELIADNGTFTLREAARRLGINHRAVYRHYADKRALLAAAAVEGVRELVAEVRAELAQQAADSSARLRLGMMARVYVRYAQREPARYDIMFGSRLNPDGRFADLESAMHEAFDLLRGEVARGVERGELAINDATDAVMSLWSTMHGFAQLVLLRRIHVRPEALEAYAEAIIDPTITGLHLRAPA